MSLEGLSSTAIDAINVAIFKPETPQKTDAMKVALNAIANNESFAKSTVGSEGRNLIKVIQGQATNPSDLKKLTEYAKLKMGIGEIVADIAQKVDSTSKLSHSAERKSAAPSRRGEKRTKVGATSGSDEAIRIRGLRDLRDSLGSWDVSSKDVLDLWIEAQSNNAPVEELQVYAKALLSKNITPQEAHFVVNNSGLNPASFGDELSRYNEKVTSYVPPISVLRSSLREVSINEVLDQWSAAQEEGASLERLNVYARAFLSKEPGINLIYAVVYQSSLNPAAFGKDLDSYKEHLDRYSQRRTADSRRAMNQESQRTRSRAPAAKVEALRVPSDSREVYSLDTLPKSQWPQVEAAQSRFYIAVDSKKSSNEILQYAVDFFATNPPKELAGRVLSVLKRNPDIDINSYMTAFVRYNTDGRWKASIPAAR